MSRKRRDEGAFRVTGPPDVDRSVVSMYCGMSLGTTLASAFQPRTEPVTFYVRDALDNTIALVEREESGSIIVRRVA